MIAINGDGVSLDPDDGDDLHPGVALDAEPHPGFQLFGALEQVARDGLHQRFIPLTVGLVGRNRDLERLAGRFSFQRGLQARNNTAGALNVGERLAVLRAVQECALPVRQGIVNRHDFVFGDLHWEGSPLGDKSGFKGIIRCNHDQRARFPPDL